MLNFGPFLLNQIFGNQPAEAIVNPFFGTSRSTFPEFSKSEKRYIILTRGYKHEKMPVFNSHSFNHNGN